MQPRGFTHLSASNEHWLRNLYFVLACNCHFNILHNLQKQVYMTVGSKLADSTIFPLCLKNAFLSLMIEMAFNVVLIGNFIFDHFLISFLIILLSFFPFSFSFFFLYLHVLQWLFKLVWSECQLKNDSNNSTFGVHLEVFCKTRC